MHRLADPPTVKLRPGYSKWLLVRISLDTTTRTYRPPAGTDIASVGIRSTVPVEREERKFWTVQTTGDRGRATIDNGEPVIVRSVRHSQRAGYRWSGGRELRIEGIACSFHAIELVTRRPRTTANRCGSTKFGHVRLRRKGLPPNDSKRLHSTLDLTLNNDVLFYEDYVPPCQSRMASADLQASLLTAASPARLTSPPLRARSARSCPLLSPRSSAASTVLGRSLFARTTRSSSSGASTRDVRARSPR